MDVAATMMVRLDLSGAGTFRLGAVDADERTGGGESCAACWAVKERTRPIALNTYMLFCQSSRTKF